MSKQPVNILKFISFRQSKHPKQLRRAPTLKESIKYGPKLLLEDQSQKVWQENQSMKERVWRRNKLGISTQSLSTPCQLKVPLRSLRTIIL